MGGASLSEHLVDLWVILMRDYARETGIGAALVLGILILCFGSVFVRFAGGFVDNATAIFKFVLDHILLGTLRSAAYLLVVLALVRYFRLQSHVDHVLGIVDRLVGDAPAAEPEAESSSFWPLG